MSRGGIFLFEINVVLKNRLVFDVWILISTILIWNEREIKFKTHFTLQCPIWACIVAKWAFWLLNGRNWYFHYHVALKLKEFLRVRTVAKDIWDLPCLLNLLFWFHMSKHRNFWSNEKWSLVLSTLASWNCFTCRNLFQNGANDMSECLTFETAFCKKAQNFV